MDYERRRVYICLKKGVYHPISPIILTTFLPSSVRRYRRPLWASSLMQTIRLCSFKSVSTLLTCFIPTPDSSPVPPSNLTPPPPPFPTTSVTDNNPSQPPTEPSFPPAAQLPFDTNPSGIPGGLPLPGGAQMPVAADRYVPKDSYQAQIPDDFYSRLNNLK